MAPRPLAPGAGLDAGRWAEQELGGAPLGDVRLSRRLVRCAQVQARAPQASFPGAAQSDRAMVKGYYRLIDRPDDSQVTPRRILAPHRARTLQRMQQAGRVLCVLDGTELNFADHPGCAGLGLIGRNRASEGTRGLHMHSLLVLDGQGVPLGVPHIQYDTHHGGRTARWQEGLEACAALAAEPGGCVRWPSWTGKRTFSACFGSSGTREPATCWCVPSMTARWARTSPGSGRPWPGAGPAHHRRAPQGGRPPCGARPPVRSARAGGFPAAGRPAAGVASPDHGAGDL